MCLLCNRIDAIVCRIWWRQIITGAGVMHILNMHQVASLLDMIGASEENIHFFKRYFLGLRDEEEDEDGEENINASEEKEGVETTIVQESWEELLQDGVGYVLHLRAHTHSLCAHIHGKNFSGPNPYGGSPRWLVEEDKEEEKEYNGDGNWFRLATISGIRGTDSNSRNNDHANSHAQGTDNEQELAAEAIDSPDGVGSEEDSKGSVESVDQGDGACAFEDLLVDLG